MRQTTLQRHEIARSMMDERVAELKKIYHRTPIVTACEELSQVLCYSEKTLRRIYYGNKYGE